MAEAMERLRAELAEARAIYDRRDETPAGEAGPTAAAVNSVFALTNFLRESGINEDDLVPLLAILAAFRDHDRGKPHPLFARKRRPGGRALSQDAAWQASVAVAVTLLIKAGVKKRDALTTVADALKKSGMAGVTRTKIETWHRETSTERRADSGALEIYRSTLDKAQQVHPDSPRLAAEQVLAALPELKL